MTTTDYEKLKKLLAMLASESDGEVLNALGAASRILNTYGLRWEDLLVPRRLLPVRGNASEQFALDEEMEAEASPPSLAEATPKIMFELLMKSGNVDSETKRDIRRHADAIKNNRVTPAIRGELQTLYNYAVLRGVQI